MEGQEDCSFPVDGHQAVLNKANKKSMANRNRTNTCKTCNGNVNKPQQKHRLETVSYILLGSSWDYISTKTHFLCSLRIPWKRERAFDSIRIFIDNWVDNVCISVSTLISQRILNWLLTVRSIHSYLSAFRLSCTKRKMENRHLSYFGPKKESIWVESGRSPLEKKP